jgi:CubicO group peptidase (beta-lactamase class C family)
LAGKTLIEMMPTAPKIVICLLFQGFMLAAQAQQQEPRYSPEIEERIRKVENNLVPWVQMDDSTKITTGNLQDRMKFYGVMGVSIAVVHHYKIDWARGYGWADKAEHRPVTVGTRFLAGSVSKSLNAVGVLKLVQEGKLDLGDDINHQLVTWKFPYDSLSKGKPITLRNLLSHSAGLTVHGFDGYQIGDSIPDIYQVLNGQPPANSGAVRSMAEPGLQYNYSSGGTMISQLMVMDATKMPYDQYMWDSVLKPLGMMNSSYRQPPDPSMSLQLASGWLWEKKLLKGKYHIYPEQSAAGLWTNPTDLCKFIIEMQLCYEGKSSKVLSPETTRTMLTPYVDSTTALGFFIHQFGDRRYFSHDGGDPGFVTFYYGSLKGGDGVAVQINSSFYGAILLSNEVINSVARVYGWKDFYHPEFRKTIQIQADSMQQYAGTYVQGRDTISIHQQGRILYYEGTVMRGNNLERLYFLSPLSFFIYEEGHSLFFANKGAHGIIQSITVKHVNRPDRTFTKQGPELNLMHFLPPS